MSKIVKLHQRQPTSEELAVIFMQELESENEYLLRCINLLEDCLQDATNIVISDSFYEGVEDYPITMVRGFGSGVAEPE